VHLLPGFGKDKFAIRSRPNPRQQMQVKTILNQCHKFKSFVYVKVCFVVENGERFIEVKLIPRRNSKAICSGCGDPAPLYDRLKGRRFEFIPLWGYRVFLVYLMRRVECVTCGVKVEQVPWASGKRELTDTYQQFLAHWAKKLSWKEVAVSFQTSWEKVFQAVEYIVQWGLQHRDLSGVRPSSWRAKPISSTGDAKVKKRHLCPTFILARTPLFSIWV